MADIGDIANVAHFVAKLFQITKQYIEGNRRTGMSQMRIAVNGRAANIKPHATFV